MLKELGVEGGVFNVVATKEDRRAALGELREAWRG